MSQEAGSAEERAVVLWRAEPAFTLQPEASLPQLCTYSTSCPPVPDVLVVDGTEEAFGLWWPSKTAFAVLRTITIHQVATLEGVAMGDPWVSTDEQLVVDAIPMTLVLIDLPAASFLHYRGVVVSAVPGGCNFVKRHVFLSCQTVNFCFTVHFCLICILSAPVLMYVQSTFEMQFVYWFEDQIVHNYKRANMMWARPGISACVYGLVR